MCLYLLRPSGPSLVSNAVRMSNAAASRRGTACKTRTEEPDRSHRRRRISRVSEHLQRQLDAFILREQLHSRRSAFHAHAYTDDDGGCAGSV